MDLDAYGACYRSSTSMLSSVPSLLSTLRVLKPSDLARNKKVVCNTAPHSSKRCKVRGSSSSSTEPKSVSPVKHIKQYSGDLIFQQTNCFVKPAERN